MTTPVFVIADAGVSARVEAALRRDPLLRVEVLDVAALTGVEPERGTAIVVVALPAPATARVLDTLRRWRRAPAIVVLSTAPGAAWSARARRAGVRAVYKRVEEGEGVAIGRRHPVVLLHGFGMNRTQWIWMARRPGSSTC